MDPGIEPDWNTPPGTIIDGYNATPPSINMKCIVFSIIVVVLYLMVPRKNNIALLFVLIGTILSVLSYDSNYDCDEGSTTRAVIAGILAVLFIKYVPARNKFVLLCCMYFPYLIMAMYDHYFDCKRNKLGPTLLALFYSWAKPMYSEQIQTYQNWHPYWKNKILMFDLIVLVIIIILLPFYLSKKFKLPQPLMTR
jgi:hypothetical protein